MYSNSATTAASSIALTESDQAGRSFVLAHPSAATGNLSKADQNSTSLIFNGDDAVILRKGSAIGTVADSYGQV